MKIGEVEVGARLAAHDEPTKQRYRNADYGDLPREVEVVEIVVEEEKVYGSRWMRTDPSSATRKVRRVKVKMIGGTPRASDRYGYRRPIASAKAGATLVVEARFLLGPWADLGGDVAKTLSLRDERDALAADLEARLAEIFGKKSSSYASVSISGGKVSREIRIADEDVDVFLSLAGAV